jgi:hypothetical protein
VKGLPVNGIKDCNAVPFVVSMKINLVFGKTTEAAELGGNVVGNGDRTNLKAAEAGGKNGNCGKMIHSRFEEPSGDDITVGIELGFPR